ncbi:hypothetical protein CP08DC60_1335, partial [Chlamydia psittaci 08DC60]
GECTLRGVLTQESANSGKCTPWEANTQGTAHSG